MSVKDILKKLLSFIGCTQKDPPSFKFKYAQNYADGLPRPNAFVELSSETSSPIAINMIIDSGADITMIPKRIGITLGLEKTGDKETISGISGSLDYYEKDIFIEMGGCRIKTRCAWVMDDDVPLLLGRKDVFDKFKILFDEKNLEVIFIPH